MGVLEMVQAKSFLGKEFLTWLWFRSELNPTFELSNRKTLEIELLDSMALDAGFGDAKSTVLRGDSPGTSPEAATALLQGKKVRRVRLKLSLDGIDWIATVDGETMHLHGLKLPQTGKIPFDEALGLRIDFLAEFEEMFSAVLEEFLSTRLDERKWKKELKLVQDWAGGKAENG